MNIEDLRFEADVVSSDGHTLGKLHRFVFRPDDRKLTHIVVDTGMLRSGEPLWKGGWGLAHDRILPIAVVKRADSKRIEITMTGDDFKDLAVPYTEDYFVPVPDFHEGPDLSDLQALLMSMPGEGGPWLMRKTEQLPPGEQDVRAGSPVWRLDPHEKVGDVDRVIFDADSKAITAIVVRRGFVFTHEVIVPVEYIVEVVAEIVRVQIDDEALKTLPRFVAPD
jgi:uncharacterized protein YrrD